MSHSDMKSTRLYTRDEISEFIIGCLYSYTESLMTRNSTVDSDMKSYIRIYELDVFPGTQHG